MRNEQQTKQLLQVMYIHNHWRSHEQRVVEAQWKHKLKKQNSITNDTAIWTVFVEKLAKILTKNYHSHEQKLLKEDFTIDDYKFFMLFCCVWFDFAKFFEK